MGGPWLRQIDHDSPSARLLAVPARHAPAAAARPAAAQLTFASLTCHYKIIIKPPMDILFILIKLHILNSNPA